ncbi:MAG: hypothetical protein JXQ73_04125 [Phycisphaerae bacterium]|nr:hypothetical protein [Phycisphaerae bacterium]
MRALRPIITKSALILLGLGSIARADDLQTIISQGKACPLLFDWVNGGNWRGLSPTISDAALCPDFTFIFTGIA